MCHPLIPPSQGVVYHCSLRARGNLQVGGGLGKGLVRAVDVVSRQGYLTWLDMKASVSDIVCFISALLKQGVTWKEICARWYWW